MAPIVRTITIKTSGAGAGSPDKEVIIQADERTMTQAWWGLFSATNMARALDAKRETKTADFLGQITSALEL